MRYLEIGLQTPMLAVKSPLRILGVIAASASAGALDGALERQRIERATAELRRRGLLELAWLAVASLLLSRRSRRYSPTFAPTATSSARDARVAPTAGRGQYTLCTA